ncbi:hypothetical protein A2U01_0040715, partial [Trifolium medium]|nr:hypothetical protein [Trifolium medium]
MHHHSKITPESKSTRKTEQYRLRGKIGQESTKVNPDPNTLRVAQTTCARRATTRRKFRKTGQRCASRQHQLRVAQTPE